MHRLPTWSDELTRVHLTREQRGGGTVRTYVHLHAGSLRADDVVMIDGFPVTSLARTVADLARTSPMMRALPMADAALALGLERSALSDAIERTAGWPGIGRARRTAAFADGRSESVGESTSRLVFAEAGLPCPVPQYEISDVHGRFVGRADFGWENEGTLGEFDGRVKYGRLLKPGQSVGDVLFEEKRREDALRDLGWQIVRWIWADLLQPEPLLERLRRAFARGRRSSRVTSSAARHV